MAGKRKKAVKKSVKKLSVLCIAAAVGFAFGMLGARALGKIGFEWSLENTAVLIVLLAGTYYLQIVLHEGGHLVFGLLTGYRFASFRIGSLMLIKKKEGLRPKRMSLAGTGGQCLLVPPKYREDFPTVLYNLGGILVNLLTGVLAFWGMAAAEGTYWKIFWALLGFFGLLDGALNGLPISREVNNDGKNIQNLLKDKAERKALWAQLQVSGEMAKGVRLKDMPEEWFSMEGEDKRDSALTADIAAMRFSRMMDGQRFEEAEKLGKSILQNPGEMNRIQRYMVQGEMLYLELIGERREEMVKKWRTAELAAFQKAMKHYPGAIRQRYAYAALYEGNEEESRKEKERFKKAEKTYPYEGDLECERELFRILEEKAREKKGEPKE